MAKNSVPPSFKHAANVAWRRVDAEAVLLNLDSSDYFSLNEAAALIWERLGKGDSLERIEAAVCAEYEVPPAAALKDIKALVKELTGKGLLLEA